LPDGRQLLRHEVTFQRQTPEQSAVTIKARLRELNITLAYVVANPTLWPQPGERGETVAETFLAAGVPVIRGTTDRVNGWARVRSLLVPQPWPVLTPGAAPIISPALLVHPDCAYFLRTFATVVASDEDPDSPEETPSLFPALALLYFAMSRPMPKPSADPPLPPGAIGHELRALRDELEAGA